MASVSGISTISKVFSKLGDNTGSVAPMWVKDITADTLTTWTYAKEGGKRDSAEKAFEEFSTGALWLGGIPFLKKIIDLTLFKHANIDPRIDAKRLFSKGGANVADTLEYAKQKALELGEDFAEQHNVLESAVNNKGLAQTLSLSKFGIATAVTGLALFGLITYKQKRTEKALEKEIREQYLVEKQLKDNINKSDVTKLFKGEKPAGNNPSFTGLANIGAFFMTNPIANTTIVDGVISGTRLVQARPAERWSEVGLKEACELIFAYGLIVPLQKSLEFVGAKVFKKPINLDYSVLDSNILKEAIEAEKNQAGSSVLLQQAKKVVELAGGNQPSKKGIAGFIDKIHPSKEMAQTANENAKKVIDFVFDKNSAELADVFKRSGDIGTYTKGIEQPGLISSAKELGKKALAFITHKPYAAKEGVEQLSLLSSIDTNGLKNTAQNTIDIIENAVKKNIDPAKYLKQTKMIKGGAIIANILISATLIGYAQPKFSLWLRKKLHGDNTNPAIAELQKNIKQKIAFEGQQQEQI